MSDRDARHAIIDVVHNGVFNGQRHYPRATEVTRFGRSAGCDIRIHGGRDRTVPREVGVIKCFEGTVWMVHRYSPRDAADDSDVSSKFAVYRRDRRGTEETLIEDQWAQLFDGDTLVIPHLNSGTYELRFSTGTSLDPSATPPRLDKADDEDGTEDVVPGSLGLRTPQLAAFFGMAIEWIRPDEFAGPEGKRVWNDREIASLLTPDEGPVVDAGDVANRVSRGRKKLELIVSTAKGKPPEKIDKRDLCDHVAKQRPTDDELMRYLPGLARVRRVRRQH